MVERKHGINVTTPVRVQTPRTPGFLQGRKWYKMERGRRNGKRGNIHKDRIGVRHYRPECRASQHSSLSLEGAGDAAATDRASRGLRRGRLLARSGSSGGGKGHLRQVGR